MSNNSNIPQVGPYVPGEMLVLFSYYTGLNKVPVAVGRDIDNLKTRAGGAIIDGWYLNCANHWVADIDDCFYIIEPIEEVK